ncbi:MAG: hypothetical protein M3332_08600 [Actinomycetota bacterium]|nr:hypothetical protein [Actinomycetota bacterium]
MGVETGGFEGTTICAFSVLDSAELAPPELRRQLAVMLRPYMVPARWRELVTLLKNVNVKIDRKVLRDRFGEDLARPAPSKKVAVS